MSLVRRASYRYYLHHPWQLVLGIIGIALGVAVIVGVDLATGSARRAFDISTSAITGTATHQIVGSTTGVPDSLYTMLRVRERIGSAAPVIEAVARAHNLRGPTLRIVGVDPLAETGIRSISEPISQSGFTRLMSERRGVLVGAPLAQRLGLRQDDHLPILIEGRTDTLHVIGVLSPRDNAASEALSDLIFADVATVQELLRAPGRLDRIDLVLDSAQAIQVRSLLPLGTELVDAGERARSTAAMTRAFEINLGALSLLALVFGMFLVYNSATFSVLQRRPLLALLRAQGVTRRELATVILIEIVVMAVVATGIGLLLGVVLAGGLVRLVARTINDLYYTVNVTQLHWSAWQAFKAIGIGIGATILSALPPLAEVTSTTPGAALSRSTLERRTIAASGRLVAISFVLALLAIVLLVIPGEGIVFGFAALFTVLLAAALLVPAGTLALMRVLRPLLIALFRWAGRVSVRGLTGTLSRTAPAIAALTISVATALSIGLMIDSFRGTVTRWLYNTLRADVYVSAPGGAANRSENPLSPAFVQRITNDPVIAGASLYRTSASPFRQGTVRLVGIDLYEPHRQAFDLLEGNPAEVWRAFLNEPAVLASEAFARRYDVGLGDSITLDTPTGKHSFRVAGIFRDYASEHGVLFMSRQHYRQYWHDDAVTSIALFLRPGVVPAEAIAHLRTLPTEGQHIMIRSNRALREASLRVFDQTFAITGVLRLLALAVAFTGVLGALMALQIERSRELAILRATGVTARQLWGVVSLQSGLMGLAAGLLAIPLGILLSWLMSAVVNRRSFGWTMDFTVSPGIVVESVLLALLAALLAGVYPSWRMSRTQPALALREE